MRINVPLGFPLGKGRSKAAGMQGICNMYGEPTPGEPQQLAFYTTPGRKAFATIGAGSASVRGQFTALEVHYVVVGSRLYSVSSAGVETDLGQIIGSGLVDMSFNGAQLDIVTDQNSYSYDVDSGALSVIVDVDFEPASSVANMSAYSIFSVAGTGKCRYSALLDSTSFDSLAFFTAEAEPDELVAVRRRGSVLVLLGANSTECWGLTGDSNAPFARIAADAAPIGCEARDTAVLVDNGLMWVGRAGTQGGRSVYRMEGFVPKKISSPQIDLLLEAVSDPTELNAFCQQQAGHQFYVLSLPNEWSFAWDVFTQQWAPRKTGSFAMGAEPTGGWDAVTFTLNGTKGIVGSADGNLYELDLATLTDAGSILVREMTCPTLSTGGGFRTLDRLELEIQSGVGLVTGQGSSPIMQMAYSKDGGQTWSAPREASMGEIGKTSQRVFWTRLGRFKNIIIKFRTTDPVTTVFLSAAAEIS